MSLDGIKCCAYDRTLTGSHPQTKALNIRIRNHLCIFINCKCSLLGESLFLHKNLYLMLIVICLKIPFSSDPVVLSDTQLQWTPAVVTGFPEKGGLVPGY